MRQKYALDTIDKCIEQVIAKTGRNIVLALPLGLGKPHYFVNSLYKYAEANPDIQLHIITALTLEVPKATNDLAQRFLKPVIERFYGDYPELLYAKARRQNALPGNIQVSEFFLSPGSLINNTQAQRSYFNSNYTHAARDLLDLGVNVAAQMVAPSPESSDQLSMSCNPDVTLELMSQALKRHQSVTLIGEVNAALPYLHGEAEITADFFDFLIEGTNAQEQGKPGVSLSYPLFPIPQKPVGLADYALAVHVSSMVKDGGTIQIGIGAMGDAVAALIALRHNNNELYQQLTQDLIDGARFKLRSSLDIQSKPFLKGLYANTEMLVEGLLFLRRQGVLTRKVYPLAGLEQLLIQQQLDPVVSTELLQQMIVNDLIQLPLREQDIPVLKELHLFSARTAWHSGSVMLDDLIISPEEQSGETLSQLVMENKGKPLAGGCYCHAGFYAGSNSFYQQLRDLDEESLTGLNMRSIQYMNHLYGEEALKRDQRRDACFINSGMMLTLMGAVVSDGLKDGQIISGVGGQYNFVAQAQALEDGRSILCFHSTRMKDGEVLSNIVWDYPHTTIPRHLRDIVVTEYGAAEIRGKSDRDIIIRILNIADSRFQKTLLEQAKAAGKIEQSYEIPPAFRSNLPEALENRLTKAEYQKHLVHYPLGSDYTHEEMRLVISLQEMKQRGSQYTSLLPLLKSGWKHRKNAKGLYKNELERMQFDQASGLKEKIFKLILIGALVESDRHHRALTKSR